MLTSKEIRDFRRKMGQRIRHLQSVLFELDRMPDEVSIRNAIREVHLEIMWARVQVDVCADMLKARRLANRAWSSVAD